MAFSHFHFATVLRAVALNTFDSFAFKETSNKKQISPKIEFNLFIISEGLENGLNGIVANAFN